MAAGRDDITQRIGLEGGAEVKTLLQQLGAAGEAAFQKLRDAAAAANTGLSSVSTVVQRVGSAFSAGREASAAFGEKVGVLRDRFNEFKEKTSEVADRIIPHFREVAALATGAGIAGFIELSREVAKTTTELSIQSRELGITPQRLQAIGAAASSVGVKTDALFQGLLRLNRSLGQIAIDARDKLLDASAQVTEQVSTRGVDVLRGGQKAALQAVTVLRGGAADTKAIIGDIAKYWDAALPIAQRARAEAERAYKMAGVDPRTIPSIQQYQNEFANLLASSEKFRVDMRDTGFKVPFQTGAEVMRNAKDAGNDLGKMFRQMGIETLDAAGKARPVDQVLIEFAQHFDQAHDKSLLAVQAYKIFGDQYAQIIPILAKGGIAIENTAAEFTKLGIAFNPLELAIGQKLDAAFNRLSVAAKGAGGTILLAFAPVLQPLIEGLTDLIKNNAMALKEWATEVAGQVAPSIQNFVAALQALSGAQGPLTPEVQNIVTFLQGLGSAAKFAGAAITTAFRGLAFVLTPLAAALNYAFGTEFTGQSLLVAAIIGRMVGLFGVLTSAVSLAGSALQVLGSGIWYLGRGLFIVAGLVSWPVTLLAGLTALVAILFTTEQGWANFQAATNAFWELMKAFAGWVARGFVGAWDGAVELAKNAWSGFVGWVTSGVNTVADWIDSLWKKVKALGDAIASIFGGGSSATTPNNDAGSVPEAAAAAGGGLMQGPGTGTSDSIFARLSNGEFVVRARAVMHYGSQLFSRLNRMELPKFADGGFISAFNHLGPNLGNPHHFLNRMPQEATAQIINLSIDGNRFDGLRASDQTADNLVRYARKRQVRSAGRAPGWSGG